MGRDQGPADGPDFSVRPAIRGLQIVRQASTEAQFSICIHSLCEIPSGGCFFTGPWTVTRSSLRMLRWVAAFCRPLRPVFLLVSFPRQRGPVVGTLWVVLVVAGGRFTGVLPTPLHVQVVPHISRRVSACVHAPTPSLTSSLPRGERANLHRYDTDNTTVTTDARGQNPKKVSPPTAVS